MECYSTDVERWTIERMKTMAAQEKLGSDAIAKSLRAYETKVHPMFIERLSVWWRELDKRSVFEGRTFKYNKEVAGLTGSNVMNYVFQSFYDQEPTEEVDVIYPKISRKTTSYKTLAKGTDMRSEVEKWLSCFCHEGNSNVVTLRQLAESELTTEVVADLLDNVGTSSLTLGIKELLLGNGFMFPSNQVVHVSGREITKELRMKVKYYPSRDDNRAYCSDGSRLRSLVAAFLNRMFSPKSIHSRLNLHSASILRPDKKDVLDISLPYLRSDEHKAYLVLLDVSNFTGSFANSWLMVYTMCLEVTLGKLEDRTQICAVGPYFVTARWSELLLLYLYLVVGVPCWIEDHSKYGYLPGGFLGVGGNITIGLLCLALILEDLRCRLRELAFYIQIQAGGDDIAIAVICNQVDEEIIFSTIEEALDAYVGQLKEFEIIDLDDYDNGLLDEHTFCKKRIFIEKSSRGYKLTGEPSVPLPETLFHNEVRGLRNQIQAWRELDYTLLCFEDTMPGHEQLTDALRALYLATYPNVKPIRSRSVFILNGQIKFYELGNWKVTDVALQRIQEIHSVEYGAVKTLTTLQSKIHHALVNEYVSLVKFRVTETLEDNLVIAEGEAKLLEVQRDTERLHIRFENPLLVELITITR